MGVLGKDLLDFHRPRTNTKVEFGASGYWVESHPTMQPYGAVLTEILNLDAAPFQELLDQYRKTVAERDAEQAARAFQAVTNGFASLPLYRLYWNDVQLFASMDVSELFVGEAQEAFREYVMQDDTLPRFMQEQLDAIRGMDLTALPETMQQTAMLRIANPESSIAELARLASPPVSKSCMNHRLKKLLSYKQEE